MWAKLSQALKPRQSSEDEQSADGVMTKVFEQHPNLSVFHGDEASQHANPPRPASPANSKLTGSRRGMFKLMAKGDDADSLRSPSPFKLPGISKKARPPIDFGRNGSQLSLTGTASDVTRPSVDAARSSMDTLRRPSISQESSQQSVEGLRINCDLPPTPEDDFMPTTTPASDNKFSSVRSILRDPHTPGTGQNVRFFSRDAYKVISPEQSAEQDYLSLPQQQPVRQTQQLTFLERISHSSPENGGQPVTPSTNGNRPSRPTAAEVFSPMNSSMEVSQDSNKSVVDMSLTTGSMPPPENTNLFNMSQQLELPMFPPPGLGFDVNAPVLDSSVELNHSLAETTDAAPGVYTQMTSTPLKPRDKGKQKASDNKENEKIESPPSTAVDDTIFHKNERPPLLPSPMHDRSQSFSFGQTVFYSMNNNSSKGTSNYSPAYPSSDLKGESPARSTPSKSRSRALSDTVFQSMLRAAKPPEADIQDDSSQDLVVYSESHPEPDPFSAHATTYYTPQTMIPTTPPQAVRHTRKTSKEESLIVSLQTQLALQTELCQQYEVDLRSRDEVVELLNKRVADLEKVENQRKAALRSWKKKVQELERVCRQLEEEVDTSRQESMERSVMDEASGEALRMLHRQIASLEHEKDDWLKKEKSLHEEVETLEGLVKDRTDDIMELKEMLWSRDESERELKEGLKEAKEQIDMLGNVSVVVDEEELRRLASEKDHTTRSVRPESSAAEIGWQQERAELVNHIERLEVERASFEERLESLQQQLKSREDEYNVLKGELEAQWQHTEKSSETIEALKKENEEVKEERDAFKHDLEELEGRVSGMELEWNESENRKQELEAEVQELWNEKEIMEKERAELDEQLRQEQEHSDDLTHAIQEREDRIGELEQENQFANENIARLEENLRKCNQELAEANQRIVEREGEVERLREDLSNVTREHSHVLEEQTRTLREVTGEGAEAKKKMEDLVRQNAETDIELKTIKNRANTLQEEVDKLRRQLHVFKQESADNEVKIVQMSKQHMQDKEDLAGLNIALDAKQQELDMLKRRMSTGKGAISAAPATTSSSSKIATHRRDSSVFTSTPITSRPPSVISDSGTDGGSTVKKERKLSSDGLRSTPSTKISALGKTTRFNGPPSSTSGSLKRDQMGPPISKPRSSLAGTPTPAQKFPSSLSRSSSAKPIAVKTPAALPHRRIASASTEQTQARLKGLQPPIEQPGTSGSEASEKENIDTTRKTLKRVPVTTPN